MKSAPLLKILAVSLLALGLCCAGLPGVAAASSFFSRNYFPIPSPGSSWTYSANCGSGAFTSSLSVTSGSVTINGQITRGILNTATNETRFYSLDTASGVQLHRATDNPSGLQLNITPAYTYAPAFSTLGVTVNNSGVLTSNDPQLSGSYNGATTPVQFELISTPAGPFRALRNTHTFNFVYSYANVSGFFDNLSSTYWAVRGVGLVKSTETDTGYDGFEQYSDTCTYDITTQNWRPIADFTARNDAVFDFGTGGLWMFTQNGNFAQIHAANPAKVLASADLDGNGQNDIVIDFGAGIGTYVWMNNSSYVFLHSASPDGVYAANLNGNAQTDLVIDFGAAGLWTYRDNSTYTFVNGANPANIVVANINGSGVDDFVVEFGGGLGIYAYVDNNLAAPVFVHGGALNNIARADIDGDGDNDVIFDFTVGGIWKYDYNGGSPVFTRIHGGTANHIVRADLDQNGVGDLVIDFAGGGGIWAYMNDAGYSFIHPATTVSLTAIEWDLTGSIDLLMDFGASGLWVYQNNASFAYVRGGNIDSITATEVNKQ